MSPARATVPVAAVLAFALACSSPQPAPEPTLVATVNEAGPVGYRDPLGTIDPTGRLLATAAQDVLQVRALAGGAPTTLPSGTSRIRHVTWDRAGHVVTMQPGEGHRWWRYDVEAGTRQPLWPDDARLTDGTRSVSPDRLAELVWSMNGRLAGVSRTDSGSHVWVVDATGQAKMLLESAAELSYPAWLPDGRLACLALADGEQRVTLPCGGPVVPGLEDREAYGPIGVSPDGELLYLATPDARGYLETRAWRLTAAPGDTTNGRPLGHYERDAYAPSVADDGSVLFKVQDYHTEVLVMPAGGGEATLRTAFQAETPSWNWTGDSLGVTYGTWRRVVDDIHYPDIAQDAGIIPASGPSPATAPASVVQASVSEDQGLTWSPNGRWIAFHSHQQGSDDIWLRPADRSAPAVRISHLGRGAEVGWPRWSPDGKWVVFEGDATRGRGGRSRLWLIGVDQETGHVTVPAHEVPLGSFDESVGDADWLGSGDQIVFSAFQPPRSHAIYRVPRTGGEPVELHRYQSPQHYDGLGASPDGTWLVYPAPDANGILQLFRVAADGSGPPIQLTADSTRKTQPAVSPDGASIAFTRWRYQGRFYLVKPTGR